MNYSNRSNKLSRAAATLSMAALLFCMQSSLVRAQKTVSDRTRRGGDSENQQTFTPCTTTTFKLTGNSATTGTNGNSRTFTVGGFSVKATAFSRKNTNNAWETAYLGAYSPGLGVTDRGENGSDPSHKVDNVGDRKDYVLFEFNQDVVVNRIFLDSVTTDSDITVWVGSGTDPYNNHLTLSDALLASFGPSEDNNATNGNARWADINAGQKVGNVLVVAASTNDASPEDYFKLGDMEIGCAPTQRAKVTIIKEVTTFDLRTASSQSFTFNSSANFGVSSFALTDNNLIGPDRRINANITAFGGGNAITVTEVSPPGWSLADTPICVETGGVHNSFGDLGLAQVRIIAEAGETITCTFKNTQSQPSAAYVTISGRAVTADGVGVSGALLTLLNPISGEIRTTRTNLFGFYTIDQVEAGTLYNLSIEHRRYTFAENSRSFSLNDELANIDFVATF